MSSISLENLKLLDYNKNKISNFILVDGNCIKCSTIFTYSKVKKFLKNRVTRQDKKHLWDTCAKCWHLLNTSQDQLWVEKNRQMQTVVQNTLEQKTKNALGVSRAWTEERKRKASSLLKLRWKEKEFSNKALTNLSWTQTNNIKFQTIINKSIKTGGLKGIYKNVHYDSALELSFLLWCERNNASIRRYDGNAISYSDETNKVRKYVPDFIYNEDTIIEIKGLGLHYRRNETRICLKLKALTVYACLNNLKSETIFSNDQRLKLFYSKARKLHHALQQRGKLESS